MKFSNQNMVVYNAHHELTKRLSPFTESGNEGLLFQEATLKAYQVTGEPNFGEKYIFITPKSGVLDEVLSGTRELHTLSKEEWNQLINPSPSNKLVHFYFKTLYNAFKVKAESTTYKGTAWEEILLLLKENFEKSNCAKN